MQKWQKRALVYKIFSIIPVGDRIFDTFRVIGGGLRNFDVNRRKYAIDEMCGMLSSAGKSVEDQNLVEIGSGWHPLLPAFFHGMGASSILMTDIVRHIKQEYVEQTMDYLLGHVDDLAQLTDISSDVLRSRWLRLKPGKHSWLDVWRDNGITYRAPFDFTGTDLLDASLDMVYSNSCLGYIPPRLLERIFTESFRILKAGGWIAHDISVYDDYSGADHSITSVNFLKYSDKDWQRIGNSRIHYQNRFRPRQYFELAKTNGFRIVVFRRNQLRVKIETLNRSELDLEFRDLENEELLCAHLLLVADKPTDYIADLSIHN